MTPEEQKKYIRFHMQHGGVVEVEDQVFHPEPETCPECGEHDTDLWTEG